MPGVGPALPPELQKRKRSNDNDDGNASDSDSADSAGPLPARPPPAQQDPPSPKRSRVIGPTLPPAPLEERPSSPAQKDESESESSDDDDGFGPSLPSAKDALNKASTGPSTGPSSNNPASLPAKRDEWMTLAPESGDWSQRVDPTKLKNRKFNTGRGAKAPAHAGAAGGDSWHETPEEKLARLQREAMGVEDRSGQGKSAQPRDPRDDAVSQRMKDYNEKARGPALYDSHQKSSKTEEEDDPSARAFDREKDIGGFKINNTQRRDMVKKAADFSSRFSSAKYL